MSSSPALNEALIAEAARIFATLSEPTRLRLLKTLMAGPLTVSEIVAATGLKQGNVSKQLGVLTQAGFLEREREGNFARFRVSDPFVQELCRLVCDKIERDAHARVAALRGEI